MREQLTYRLYAGAWALVRRLPEPAAYRLFDLVADLAWRRHGPSVRRLEANLRRARPGVDAAGLRALSRAGMRSYLAYWCDAFRLPDWDRDRVVSTVRVVGEDYLRASTGEGGRGVVGALMHMGNWDHAGAWATLTDVPVVTVAERLRPAFDGQVARKQARYVAAAQLFDSLNYKSVLARGFALVRDGEGVVLRSAAAIAEGQKLVLEFVDGTADAIGGRSARPKTGGKTKPGSTEQGALF